MIAFLGSGFFFFNLKICYLLDNLSYLKCGTFLETLILLCSLHHFCWPVQHFGNNLRLGVNVKCIAVLQELVEKAYYCYQYY